MKIVPFVLVVSFAVCVNALIVEAAKHTNFMDDMTDSSDSSAFESSEAVSSKQSEQKTKDESYVKNSVNSEDDNSMVSSDNYKWTSCPKDMFLRAGKCRPCSQCGPDLYARNACLLHRDTVCDWCLNPTPLKNVNFRLKCSDVIELQSEFNNLLEQRTSGGVAIFDAFPVEDSFTESTTRVSVIKPSYSNIDGTLKTLESLASLSIISYKVELLLKYCLYFALIVLMFVIIRFITKSKPYYRTVTVTPPVFDDHEKTNIIRAADEIRDKLGKKGYNRLEEFI